jgi:hypothetical protein
MDEKWGVLEYMKKRIEKNGLCVVVIAEGAGQVHYFTLFTTLSHIANLVV